MTNLPAGKELDAKVLAAMGWDVWQTKFGEWRCHAPSAVGSDRQRRWTMLSNVNVSTSDAEAVRLCLPWLVERANLGMFRLWRSDKNGYEFDMERKPSEFGKRWKFMVISVNGDTLSHALCLAVLAVAARGAEQKETTT